MLQTKGIKRIISTSLSAVMLLVCTFTFTITTFADTESFNIETATGAEVGTMWFFDGTVLSISSGADIEITGTVSNGRRIEVTADTVNTNIILNDLSITGLSDNQSPLFVKDSANIMITLLGENVLTAGKNSAGIQVADSAIFTITSASTGSLSANGGDGGAGIGGVLNGSGGTINIDGGTITAIGNGDIEHCGAGIGSGYSTGDGSVTGNITISGGTITATGSSGIGGGSYFGGGNININGGTITTANGIGGGFNSRGGNINISGGIIEANVIGGSYYGGSARVGGIGKAGGKIVISGGTVTANTIGGYISPITGEYTADGDFSINGSAVVHAKTVDAVRDNQVGILFDDSQGNNALFYGESIIPTNDFSIPTGKTLIIPRNAILTISEDVTITNNDIITNNGTLINKGNILGSGSILGNGIVTNNGIIENIMTAEFSITDLSKPYTGSPQVPAITNNRELVEGTDYTVTYNGSTDKPKEVGKYDVEIEIINQYFKGIGTSTAVFEIYRRSSGSSATSSKVSPPTASVASGEIPYNTKVTLSTTTSDAKIYYTLDGSMPTKNSTLYTSPIVIDKTLILKAIAIKSSMTNSNVTTVNLTIIKPDFAFKSDANSIKYIKAYSDNTFKPDQAITRYEMLESLNNLLDFGKSGSYNLTDVNPEYNELVGLFTSAGIIEGFDDSMFHGNEGLTRAELTKIISIILSLETKQLESKFSDIKGHWAEGYINNFASLGYLKGYEDGTFRPDNKITRAEFVVIVNRIVKAEPISAPPVFDDLTNYWAYGDIMAVYMK